MKLFLTLFFLSFVIQAFGQEDFIPFLAPLASFLGFALFWESSLFFEKTKQRFYAALLWFFLVQLVKLLWVASPEHLGPWIIFFYFFASLFIAFQFALVCLLIKKEMNWFYIFMVASLFTLMEYSRVHILMGFTWNPSGLALAAYDYTLQVASIAGVYGLTFLVYLTNLILFKLINEKIRTKNVAIFLSLLVFPYIFGFVNISIHERDAKDKESSIKALLVQTAILQGDRVKLEGRESSLTPLEQWAKIFGIIKPFRSKKNDLLILPEGVVPYPVSNPIYTHLSVVDLFYKNFGRSSLKYLPPLNDSYAKWIVSEDLNGGFWAVNNAFVAQGLSNYFKADLMAGFEVVERSKNGQLEGFQSLILFKPGKQIQDRYDKQILVPLGECLPFKWCEKLANYFGVTAFFTPGKESKVLDSKVLIGPSVCYEETYGHLLLKTKRMGAKCLVNITNDGWFPGIRLIKQHYSHAKLRAVELGVPLLRACTTGVTCAINAFGQKVAGIEPKSDPEAKALEVDLPLFDYTTLYEKTGDYLVVFMSVGFIFFYLIKNKKISVFLKKKR